MAELPPPVDGLSSGMTIVRRRIDTRQAGYPSCAGVEFRIKICGPETAFDGSAPTSIWPKSCKDKAAAGALLERTGLSDLQDPARSDALWQAGSEQVRRSAEGVRSSLCGRQRRGSFCRNLHPG